MSSTIIQSLPLIAPSQAQKHVTHNEALARLDVMVQLAVQDRSRTNPPASPATGQRHIVASPGGGDWAGKAGRVAVWNGTAWEFHTPLEGWRAYVAVDGALAYFDGAGWFTAAENPARFAELGVNASADTTNRLSVKSPASLFDAETAGHQVKVNKVAGGNTASIAFQTGYSTRAEIGTLGNNDFAVKVSADGSSFTQAVVVDKDTGKLRAMQGLGVTPTAGDIASPADGDIWYNATTGKFRVQQGGSTVDMLGAGGGSTFSDAAFTLQDNGDATKQAQFQLSGLTSGATRSYTLPDVSTEVMGLAGTQVVTGTKTFAGAVTFSGAQIVADSNFTLQDDADATKKAQFQLSGLTTGTTRSYALPDASVTLAGLGAAQTFSAAQTFAAASNSFGTSTAAGTTGLATGATVSGSTKAVNIGTAGVAGSTTAVSIGSAVAGALGSLVVNSPNVTFASSVSSVAMASASVTALYLGLGGATADATNRLSVNAPATLLNNAGAGHQVKVNKAAATDTASLLFQTGFSGRAEMGTTGSDDFLVKVSADGATFFDGLSIDRTNGRLRAMNGLKLNPAAGDLGAPADGDLWYNTTLSKFRARQAGATVDLIPTAFSDAAFTLTDNLDATKKAQFELSGLTTATTRTYTLPNATGTLALNSTVTSTAAGLAPASGGGTANFLRADGTWAAPAAGGGVSDGDKGDVVVSGTGTVWALDYAAVNPVIAPVWANITATPTTTTGYGITDAVVKTGAQTIGGAKTFNAAIVNAGLTSDPASPADGAFWFDAQTQTRKARIGGTTRDLLADFVTSGAMAWKPQPAVATLTVLGLAAPTAVGTATAASVATTNKFNLMPRLEYLVTTAATTAVAGFRSTANVVTVGGSGADLGGFRSSLIWGPATGAATATNRAFAGYAAVTSAPTDVEPSTAVSAVFMGWDAADANVQMMFNDGTATCTKIDLGASFPVPTADRSAIYKLDLFSPKGTVQSVQWRVTDMVSGVVAQGTQTTDLPTTTTLLAPRGWMSVGGTSSVIGLALFGLYLDPLI